jgi:hypothetical protein
MESERSPRPRPRGPFASWVIALPHGPLSILRGRGAGRRRKTAFVGDRRLCRRARDRRLSRLPLGTREILFNPTRR